MKRLFVFACAIGMLSGCADFRQPTSSGSSAAPATESERTPWIGDHTHPGDIYFGD